MRERSKGVFIILIAGVLVTGGLGTIHKLRPEQIIKKNLIQQQSAQQRVQEKSIEETFDEKTLKEDSKEPVHEQQSLGQPTQEQPVQEQPTQQQPIKEQVINKQTVQDENEKPKVTKQIPGVVWSIPTKSRVVFITIVFCKRKFLIIAKVFPQAPVGNFVLV